MNIMTVSLKNKTTKESFVIRMGHEQKASDIISQIKNLVENHKKSDPNMIIAMICSQNGMAYDEIPPTDCDWEVDIDNPEKEK